MSETSTTIKMQFQMTVNSHNEIAHVTPEPTWTGMIGRDQWKASLVFGGGYVFKNGVIPREISLVLSCDKNIQSNLWKMSLEGVCSTRLLGGVTDRPFRAVMDYKSAGVHVVENVCTPFKSKMFANHYGKWAETVPVSFELKLNIKNSMMNEVPYHSLLVRKPKYTDIEFKFNDGARFFANKVLLSNCSAIFKTMLSGSYKESKEGIIDMKDQNSEIFHAFLRLMNPACDDYVQPEMIPGVLEFAHYYDVPYVTQTCEKLLKESMMRELSCYELLKIADQYTLHYLNAVTFAHLPPNETYRIIHDPQLKELKDSTQKRLKRRMRVLDNAKHFCQFCKGKPYQDGIPWAPLENVEHNQAQRALFSNNTESFRPAQEKPARDDEDDDLF